MRITAQEEYGLRCMLQVARAGKDRLISGATIARAEGISPPHAAKLLNKLKRGGLVKGSTGVKGGYRPGRDLQKITVLDVLMALDAGGLLVADFDDFCGSFAGRRNACVHGDGPCPSRSMWSTIARRVRKALGQVTLGELAAGDDVSLAVLFGTKLGDGSSRRRYV